MKKCGRIAPQAAAVPFPPLRPQPRPAEEAIPADFHGVYEPTPQACGLPSDGRLAVTRASFASIASIGSGLHGSLEMTDLIRVEADYQGEGENGETAMSFGCRGVARS